MQLSWEFVLLENLVPQDHIVRKLKTMLNLSFVREKTRSLYSKNGRPSVDPVEYLLISYLFGIPSERQIEWRIQTDVALRWYLGLSLSDSVPDHSTIS